MKSFYRRPEVISGCDRKGVCTGPMAVTFCHCDEHIGQASTDCGGMLFLTLGGGAVLMLRHCLRESRDIDFFVKGSPFLSYAHVLAQSSCFKR